MPVFTVKIPNQPYSLAYRLSTPASKTAETIDPAYPTVLFCHPPWVDSFFFYPQFDYPELYQNYNLLAIDMPGHGSSHIDSPFTEEYSWQNAADDFYRALEVLATGPVHLVGSAVGGLTALRLALSHPEITESLTIVAPPLEDEPEFVEEAFDEWLKEIEKAVADRDIESLESLSNYVFDFCTGQVGDPALREMMDEYGYMVQVKMASGELESALPICSSLLRSKNMLPSMREMEGINCPVFIIESINNPQRASRTDLYTNVVDKLNEAAFRSGKPPNAAKRLLEGALIGRWITLTNPDPVNLILAEFLRTKSPDSLPSSPNPFLTTYVARRPSTPRDITGFTILPPPKLAPGRKTLGEMMDELERKGQAGVNVEVEVSVHVDESTI
ncbi:hypothetical protein I312_102201 [Cryptococcus bacillisporus CA1280]|uniref:Unplaced genomic scaffold supercont1.4, whole genome shotgun sequence n=1 Tax=Cryptococcus bacillisporus CA1280 TaxID=1296109 RepID=A0A0D0TQ09_CRYGA|nr:hypothetical protein I312_01847 [Cryptococcus bacillisporus CA1280]